MRKLLPLLILPLLVSCTTKEEVATEPSWPTYCIREVIFLDEGSDPNGRVLLDMPGYPYGQTNLMQEISRRTYNELDLRYIDACKSDDPRMTVEPRGIAYTDGTVVDLDGNPLQ